MCRNRVTKYRRLKTVAENSIPPTNLTLLISKQQLSEVVITLFHSQITSPQNECS